MLIYEAGSVGWNTFFGCLLPHIEQGALVTLAANSGAIWGGPGGNEARRKPIKILRCPSDPTYAQGLAYNASDWSTTSYAPIYNLFGSTNVVVNGGASSLPKYTVANIIDGTSNQIAIVERYANYTYHGWTNRLLYPEGWAWGWNSNGSVYGPWGLYLPQLTSKATGGNWPAGDAHPYMPNTAHSTMQTLMMDGSVKQVGRISQATWNAVCTPDDAVPLGNNW